VDTATAYDLLLATPAPKFKCNFTAISTLPSEITFSRAGNAMQFDATGTLTWAPNNNLTYSEDISVAGWAKTNGTVSGTDLFLETTATGEHRVTQSVDFGFVASRRVIYSVEIETYGTGRNAWLGMNDNISGVLNYWIDLSTGVLTLIGAAAGWSSYSAGATQISAGKWRVYLTGISSAQSFSPRVGTYNSGVSFAGDAAKGVYARKHQLEQVTYQTTPGPYVATTSAAYYGPRFDNTPWSPTNLMTNSNAVTSAGWGNAGFTSLTQGAPDPNGGTSAWTLTETTSSTYHTLQFGVAVTLGQPATASVFLAAGTRRYVAITMQNAGTNYFYAIVDTQTWTVTGSGGLGTGVFLGSSVQSAGNGFYRVSVTGSIPAIGSYTFDVTGSSAATYGGTWNYLGNGSTIILFGAQTEQFATQTTPGPYVATTTAAVVGVGTSPLGLLIEEARTNVVLHNRDLTNAAWTLGATMTRAKNQIGIDGVANSASSITGGAVSATNTILQAITLTSSARFQSAYVKRLVGTGVVNMTTDGGTTWTAITVTSAYTRVTIPTQTLANPSVGFQIMTSTDSIAVDFVQNENGTFATSPIFTSTAAVTRAADIVPLGGALASIIKGTVGSVIMEATYYPNQTYAARILCDGNSGGSNIFGVISSTQFDNLYNLVSALNPILGSGLTTSRNRIGASFSSSGRSTVGNNGVVVSDTALKNAYAAAYLGTSNGSNMANMWVSGFVAWNKRLPNLTLKAKTVLDDPL